MIRVQKSQGEVVATFAKKRWVFPEEDCMILPVINTTAEEIAGWIGKELIEQMYPKWAIGYRCWKSASMRTMVSGDTVDYLGNDL